MKVKFVKHPSSTQYRRMTFFFPIIIIDSQICFNYLTDGSPPWVHYKIEKRSNDCTLVFFSFLKFLSGSGNHPQDDLAKSVDDLARFGDKTYESKNIKNSSIFLATSCK
jgi:hypothetical protein